MRFEFQGRKYNLNENIFEKVAKAAFSILGEREGLVEARFVSEQEIRKLNYRYRGKNKETDVLSFLLNESPLIGQIVICYTRAKKQAIEYGETIDEEIIRLLIHGITHLYGYDHESVFEENKMKKIENKIQESIR